MEKDSRELWTVSNGTYNNRPIITRIRTDLHRDEVKKYPFRIGIAIPLLDSSIDGLPTPEENIALSRMEESLLSKIEKDDWAVLCAVLMTEGMKEFVMYARDQNTALFEDMQKEYPNYNIQSYFEEDRNWIGYNQLCRENGL